MCARWTGNGRKDPEAIGAYMADDWKIIGHDGSVVTRCLFSTGCDRERYARRD